MRRRRKKFDIYIVIVLFFALIGYFIFNTVSGEDKGINAYQKALIIYKRADFENAYQAFRKVPSTSSLKEAALFRQARCATNLGKKELAIKKYNRIIHSGSKSSIVPISEYNMAHLFYELKDNRAKKHFRKEFPLFTQKRKVEYADTQSGYMMIGFRGVNISDNDTFALDVLAEILGAWSAGIPITFSISAITLSISSSLTI